MKISGGNQVLFCEQVGTVTSFFEQWNDCERTVVLYALLKRVPFANLKFLQLSIDYNLAQNYSSQSKLQLLETHANNANFLNKLVQRYQTTCCGMVGAGETGPTANNSNNNNNNNNNNNCNIANNNLTPPDSGYDSEKKNSTFDLSSTSSSSCSSTSGMSCGSSSSQATTPAATVGGASATNKADQGNQPPSLSTTVVAQSKTKLTETKKDILNDMLTYLPLLKPGNDDVKSVYMSLIPAAVEDACQQAVPTELVQHILSYLLIHPAVNNDDRRSLSYWLRHLEEHIASSYIPTTLTTTSSAVAATASSACNNTNNNANKLTPCGSSYFILPPAANAAGMNQQQQHQQQQSLVGRSNNPAAPKSGSQQSLQFLAAGSWHHLPRHQQHHHQQQQQQHPHLHQNSGSGSTDSSNQLSQQPTPSLSISNSTTSLLSKSQQSLNQASSSSSSSSSCLDSTASQLLKTTNMLVSLDWTPEVPGSEEGDRGGGNSAGSMENVSIKEFVPVPFGYHTPAGSNKPMGNSANNNSSSNSTKHHHLIASSSQAQGYLGNSSVNSTLTNGNSLNLNGSGNLSHTMVLTDLDSSDDNHLSFSKNGTEIFDYDCDYDNEEEFNYLARAAAVAAASGGASSIGTSSSSGVHTAAGSAVTAGTGTGTVGPGSSSGSSKNRVSFDANISDYLRVPPIAVGDFDMDGSGLLKTRRSNSLTTTVSSACGLSVGELNQQKQNNECLSAENLSNLQLLQNKPRSFSLTMESPRSSLTSSGSETRLDDFKQHQMAKMYGQPNVGMSGIAHWLKSLRLHKYVWLFSNLTYEQMLDMNEEYLASLGVTKGARHKLVLCIQKLKERYGVLVQMEKDLLATGGTKGQLTVMFEELTGLVLTPIKPTGLDRKDDIPGQFMKLFDLIGSILLARPVCGSQEEEYLNVYTWLLERALHNEAFAPHVVQIKEYKYKANKIKMQFTPKAHYVKNANLNGNINKPRWSATNKHKSNNASDLQKTPHRKSSLQYFTSPMQQQSQPSQQQQQQQNTSSSHSHLQAIPHQYQYGHGHNANAGTGHNNNYNKSSSYPNFASNLSSSGGGSGGATIGTGSNIKHHSQQGQSQIQGQQHQPQPSQQQQQPKQQLQQQQVQLSQQTHVPHGNFMYHRHSLNNISAHQHQQQFLQQLQQSQQPQQSPLLPSIYLTTMGGGPPVAAAGGKVKSNPSTESGSTKGTAQQKQSSGPSTTDLLGSKSQNNSIGDINSRLEFLCLQMTEQAIN
ncbi:protein Smaug [Topomyia yanbarensis]|uniref:protein Smaug n=1 Tax=Topomyia yanbarensis TaxID=2498891 RepID=UPI00273B8504|nr:protein Smaug [Topomyia yanbarensis]